MPIPHRIRVHPRARHVRLRVEPREGLVVTVPRGFDRRAIPALLAERAEWIERVQARIASERAAIDPDLDGPRPQRIELPAINECWPVRYGSSSRQVVEWSAGDGVLALQLPHADRGQTNQRVAACLQAWLKKRAKQALVPMVGRLSTRYGFDYGRISVRNQRSRWGSCSAVGNLSLNARLLFAPPAACRYVLIHELVHTEHPDHSPAFWGRVAEIDPGYRQSMETLNTVWQRLPAWV